MHPLPFPPTVWGTEGKQTRDTYSTPAEKTFNSLFCFCFFTAPSHPLWQGSPASCNCSARTSWAPLHQRAGGSPQHTLLPPRQVKVHIPSATVAFKEESNLFHDNKNPRSQTFPAHTHANHELPSPVHPTSHTTGRNAPYVLPAGWIKIQFRIFCWHLGERDVWESQHLQKQSLPFQHLLKLQLFAICLP